MRSMPAEAGRAWPSRSRSIAGRSWTASRSAGARPSRSGRSSSGSRSDGRRCGPFGRWPATRSAAASSNARLHLRPPPDRAGAVGRGGAPAADALPGAERPAECRAAAVHRVPAPAGPGAGGGAGAGDQRPLQEHPRRRPAAARRLTPTVGPAEADGRHRAVFPATPERAVSTGGEGDGHVAARCRRVTGRTLEPWAQDVPGTRRGGCWPRRRRAPAGARASRYSWPLTWAVVATVAAVAQWLHGSSAVP